MLDVQKRSAEMFRLRFGDQRGNNHAPRKLTDSMRVTSYGRDIIEAFVDVYGGEPSKWQSPKGSQWEAYLPITEIPIWVLPGDSLSQWWEQYRGQVCEKRCNGEFDSLSGEACSCPADIGVRMKTKNACRPMTRVNIACPTVSENWAGAFVSHGMTAAETLPQAVWFVEGALRQGVRVPATLRIVEHKGRRHFIVPQIEPVRTSTAALVAAENGDAMQISAPPTRALESGGAEEGTEAGEAHSDPAARPASPIPRHDEPPPLPHEIEGAEAGSTGPTLPRDDDSPAPSLPAPNTVAMWCKDNGVITDDERHEFLEAYSEGRYTSSHDVPADEMADLHSALIRWKRGELTIVASDDSPILVDRQSGSPDTSPAPPALIDHAWWMEAIRDVRGVGQAKLLGRAREIANELGQPAPTSLNAVTDPKLVDALRTWLKEQA